MSRFIRAGRTWFGAVVVGVFALAVLIPAPSFADLAGGCDFAPTGTTANCQGALSPSTFAGGDGNLKTSPTTYGTTDWENVSGRHGGVDLASGTSDNSFGKGTKEDDANVNVVTGSIPPNKSDLTRFYEASETIASNGHTYLYLAWERSNVLGNANMDFEINKLTQPDLTTAGAKTLNRSAGDLLVTYDFTNGGGRPTIGLLRWVTGSTTPSVTGFPTNSCFSANAFPCWGDEKTLDGTEAIGAVNNLDAVTDPINPNAPRSIPALEFGETAIDLNAADVFTGGECGTFGSVFLKSRASSSFPAEVKDFVAPVPAVITNCGEIKIIKHTDPRGVNQNFSYTSTINDPASGSSTPTCTTDSTPSSFTLNDSGNTASDNSANTEDCINVLPGNYTVTEGSEPSNFTLESLSCTPSDPTGANFGVQHAAGSPQADIKVAAGGVVTCTYTNQQQLGALKVTKVAKDKNCSGNSPPAGCTNGKAPLAGAGFEIWSESNSCSGLQTTANDAGCPANTPADTKVKSEQTTALSGSGASTVATTCFSGLAFGSYYVHESTVPTGYAGADTTDTVSGSSTCAGTPDSVTVEDTPLTDVVASATAEVPGATHSTVSCLDSTSTDIGNSPQTDKDPADVDANGLQPGVYTCTITIDP